MNIEDVKTEYQALEYLSFRFGVSMQVLVESVQKATDDIYPFVAPIPPVISTRFKEELVKRSISHKVLSVEEHFLNCEKLNQTIKEKEAFRQQYSCGIVATQTALDLVRILQVGRDLIPRNPGLN